MNPNVRALAARLLLNSAPANEARPTAVPYPVLDIAIPVYNEEIALPGCVRRLHAHLSTQLPYSFRITIADNASTDGTLAVARPPSSPR